MLNFQFKNLESQIFAKVSDLYNLLNSRILSNMQIC